MCLPKPFTSITSPPISPVKYLRVIPSPLLINMLAVMASVMPYLKPEAQK